MSKKIFVLFAVTTILLATNIATVFLYNAKIANLREQSSFIEIANKSDSLKKCLDRIGVENKLENGKILIREIDSNQAISACS